jgi:hypothetical protein
LTGKALPHRFRALALNKSLNAPLDAAPAQAKPRQLALTPSDVESGHSATTCPCGSKVLSKNPISFCWLPCAGCGPRTHEDVSVTVGLDPMWQASQIRIREQFLPALEVEGRLYFRGMELNRQRHWAEPYSIDWRTASSRVPGGCPLNRPH